MPSHVHEGAPMDDDIDLDAEVHGKMDVHVDSHEAEGHAWDEAHIEAVE